MLFSLGYRLVGWMFFLGMGWGCWRWLIFDVVREFVAEFREGRVSGLVVLV